jgi:hypothetical protein
MPDLVAAAGGAGPLAWLVVVVFAAYALRGATGFGAGVVSIPLLALAFPLPIVIVLITVTGFVASSGQTLREFRNVAWRPLRLVALPTLAGVALGLWLFAALDARLLLRIFAVFIVGYGLFSFSPPRQLRVHGAWLAVPAGALGGLVATLFGGMAGPFYVVYFSALGIDRARFRASMAFVLLAMSAVRIAGYGGLGFLDTRALLLLVFSLPVMAVAMWAGERWQRRWDEARFRRVVSSLLVASGGALLLK